MMAAAPPNTLCITVIVLPLSCLPSTYHIYRLLPPRSVLFVVVFEPQRSPCRIRCLCWLLACFDVLVLLAVHDRNAVSVTTITIMPLYELPSMLLNKAVRGSTRAIPLPLLSPETCPCCCSLLARLHCIFVPCSTRHLPCGALVHPIFRYIFCDALLLPSCCKVSSRLVPVVLLLLLMLRYTYVCFLQGLPLQ